MSSGMLDPTPIMSVSTRDWPVLFWGFFVGEWGGAVDLLCGGLGKRPVKILCLW